MESFFLQVVLRVVRGGLDCIRDRWKFSRCAVRKGERHEDSLRPGKICGVWIGTGHFLIGIESKKRLSS
jgi:hypothetical protein